MILRIGALSGPGLDLSEVQVYPKKHNPGKSSRPKKSIQLYNQEKRRMDENHSIF